MDDSQKKKAIGLVALIVVAIAAGWFAYGRAGGSQQLDVVGSLPQASKSKEMQNATGGAPPPGVDPADVGGGKR